MAQNNPKHESETNEAQSRRLGIAVDTLSNLRDARIVKENAPRKDRKRTQNIRGVESTVSHSAT